MSDVYVFTSKHVRLGGGGSWGVLSQEIFRKFRCSEIASGAIFGRKQCRGSYYVFHPILAVLHAFAKPADFTILRDKVLSMAEQYRWGVINRTTGELSIA